MRSFCLAILVLLAAAAASFAQAPLPFAPPPTPLLYVRLAEPKGMKVTIFTGQARPATLETPCTLGFRPGYVYRLALSDVPGFPRQVFFPTLEVRGSLLLGPKLRPSHFPVALNFPAEDLARSQEGAMLKKVVVLERPDRAMPQTSSPVRPLEITLAPPRDPLVEAREHGETLAVLNLGPRTFDAQEMASEAIVGTVLLPGETFLPTPRIPPYVVWRWCPVYDPLHGPVHPSEFVTVYDGGDSKGRAALTRDGKVVGVDPSDTVAEYTDSLGLRKLSVSNRVALCIPRFVLLRSETILSEQVVRYGPGTTTATKGQGTITAAKGLQLHERLTHLEALAARQRLSGVINTYGTAVLGKRQGTQIVETIRAVEVVNGMLVPPEAAALDRPLLIIKWPDKEGALVGDLVTFHLKVTNQGDLPISGVVVTDSLTNRLEYVAHSEKADRQAVFTTQPNEAGSQVLRWEFAGTLFPHESGTIAFQVRVR